ncbi:sulfotransferase family protein [Novosphingobium bradum]|uniref:Sulfotransferase family protein n=1 Tax=Novosphingobium bradum TaxID=1737444 RepID=A0ABV7IQW7_9SPHN
MAEGWGPGPWFTVDELLAEAEAVTGLADWGDDEFREPLGQFVASLNAEARLTAQGVARAHSHIRKMLVGRLRLYEDRKRFPAIGEERIAAPLFITGHGRSGTSYLNALLAADPRHHAPRHWQIWTLSPPVNHPDTDNGPQMAQGRHYIDFEGWADPEVRTRHDYSWDGVAEDTLISDYSFVGKAFPFFWNVPGYGRWLASHGDARAGLRIERKILQALQYGCPRDRWVLKNPTHLGILGDLFAEFPDARVIVNHRDPVKSLASMVGLLHAHRRQFGNAPVEVGRLFMLGAIAGAVATTRDLIRRRQDPAVDARFIDVHYLDLERDPLGEVGRIYERFGIAFTPQARAAMAAHIAANRKGKFGAHRYDIRELGVSVAEVREAFGFYYEAFAIPFE